MSHRTLKRLSAKETMGNPADNWIALGYLAFMCVMELKTEEVVSPLLSMLAFGFFAQRMQPRFVAFWATLYTVFAFMFLLEPWHAYHGGRVTPFVRCGTLALAGIGAVLLSRTRVRVAESFQQTMTILEQLPAPVVLSDCAGCIVFMNDDALKLLETTPDEAVGASYFLFMAEGERGKSIQKYLDIVDARSCQLDDVSIQVKKPSTRIVRGSIVSIQANHVKLLATVLRGDGNG